MIQDILPKHFYNQYEEKSPKADSRVMFFLGNEIHIKGGEMLDFPTYAEIEAWCRAKGRQLPDMVYLFTVEGEMYFLAENLPIPQLMPVKMQAVRPMHPKERVLAAATAWHLYVWYRDNRFCGRCGHRTRPAQTLRMLECPSCGNQIFPKIAPAVIAGVTDGERILMTKYANRDYKRYALIAGFTEIGETAEETVQREVMEEVGLRVKNIRYYKSQPWGFDSDLLLGYFCELDDAAQIVLDTEELSVAEWVEWKDIPDDPEGLSLTREMMLTFRETWRKKNR